MLVCICIGLHKWRGTKVDIVILSHHDHDHDHHEHHGHHHRNDLRLLDEILSHHRHHEHHNHEKDLRMTERLT